MASYCPDCGAPAPDEARFCMKCGRERVPAGAAASDAVPPAPSVPPEASVPPVPPAPPGAPPLAPPPPMYAPGPARPSPVGAFLGRTFRGDWAGAGQAALWPVGLLLIAAVGLAIPSYGQGDDVVVGFADRMRVALAVLLQALGGGFELKEAPQSVFGGGGGDMNMDLNGGGSLSLVPLTVTVLWVGALVIGVRMLRTRTSTSSVEGVPQGGAPQGGVPQGGATAGLEAAVRVALLVTAAVLVLGLFAQPTLAGAVKISSSPWLAALGALLLGFAVAGGVLHRDDLARWPVARPGVRVLLRATGTALRALTVVLVLCSVVAFICLTQIDGLDDAWDTDGVSPLVVALLVLPNLAVTALGLSWGAPVDAEARGSSPYGGGYEHKSFGLSELADATNSWAVVGALALGLVCALTLGVLAARRSADRREQMLAAAVFFGLFLLLAGVSGLGWEVATGSSNSDSGYGSDYGSDFASGGSAGGTAQVGLSIPDALLFGLLWIFVAAFVAPYVVRRAGGRMGVSAVTAVPGMTAPPVQGIPPMPGGPVPAAAPVPPSPTPSPYDPSSYDPSPSDPSPYDLHTVHLGHQPLPSPSVPLTPLTSKPRSRALVWTVTLAIAFVVGGGAAAGVLVWQDHRTKGASASDDKPEATSTPTAQPTQSETPTPTPTPTEEPTDKASTEAAELPDSYHQLTDPMGFSLAVPDVWAREGVKNGTQVTYAGSTGLEHIQVGVIANAGYTSYDNFLTLEKTAKKKDTDYRRITLESNTFQGRAGAIWEYTYTDESGRTVHAKDQSYVADDGTEYAIMLVGYDDMWESDLAGTFQVALDSWQLT